MLDEIAAETGTNRNRVVLAWLIGGNPAITPIVGVSTLERLDEAIAGGVAGADRRAARTPGPRGVTYQDSFEPMLAGD